MAKIIFSTISGIPNSKKLPCFYEGLVNALVRNGNEVMLMITNQLMDNSWSSNRSSSAIDTKKLSKEITNFNPDFVIACNNSLYEFLPKLVSCPIAIYGTDSPALFVDKELLKRNAERYHFLMASDDFIPMAKEYFGTKMKSLNVLHFATDFCSKKIEQNKNISFIGTDFSFSSSPFKKVFAKKFNDEDKEDFKIFLKSFRKNVLLEPQRHLEDLGISSSAIRKISHADFLNLISSNFRIQVLQSVADLGLAVYGSNSWIDTCNSSVDLALSYSDLEVSSVSDNQNIYNSSKISINISHAQAGRAFSWRVRDIMACNSVLVSDPREDLVTQFGKYVKIPTYETPYEARQICQKLLQDDVWRREIIVGSQLAIEEGHRFKHRLKDLEEMVGVELICKNRGSLIEMGFFNYPIADSIAEKSKNSLFKKNGKVRSWLRKNRKAKKAIKEFKKSLKHRT